MWKKSSQGGHKRERERERERGGGERGREGGKENDIYIERERE